MTQIISVFNNKGGVGKTTLTYHMAQALSEMGHKVLLIDADPQCNLTIYALPQDYIHDIWEKEDSFIDGFEEKKGKISEDEFDKISNETRSLHYLLMPTEEGTGDLDKLPPPAQLNENLDLIPGRLTLHLYEEKIASRWSGLYRGEPLSLRTVTKIRNLSDNYAKENGYDFVIIDTSPSLGILNKVIISTVDGFIIPAAPDLFSLYGIKNIGKALSTWQDEFTIIYKLISKEKRHFFPKQFVTFLGYTIYNAKKYTSRYQPKGQPKNWDLAQAHYNYAKRIPETIRQNIDENIRKNLTGGLLREPIGGTAVMHSHNTFPSMAQYYNSPMWKVPSLEYIEDAHAGTLRGSCSQYERTKDKYILFCEDLKERLKLI